MSETASTIRRPLGSGTNPTADDAAGLSREADTFAIPIDVAAPVLAVGAETKGVFGLAVGGHAWLSRDFGPLTDARSLRAFRHALDAATARLGGVKLETVARDLHPGYVSSELAASLGLGECVVQHHHAHVASCMAEHQVTRPVIGICCDGAGCGLDKASWGCEILEAMPADFARRAHLRYFSLPGADAAATQCWRPALSLVRQAYGPSSPIAVERLFEEVDPLDRRAAEWMLARGLQCPQTSSMGRLFDAVSFLLGVCPCNVREGQAAQLLEAAGRSFAGRAMETALLKDDDVAVLDFGPVVRDLCTRKMRGVSAARLAADFHETVAAALASATLAESQPRGIASVVLSGGCFANRLLSMRLRGILTEHGLNVLEHQRVSCGDGGIALGQLMVAAARLRAGRNEE